MDAFGGKIVTFGDRDPATGLRDMTLTTKPIVQKINDLQYAKYVNMRSEQLATRQAFDPVKAAADAKAANDAQLAALQAEVDALPAPIVDVKGVPIKTT